MLTPITPDEFDRRLLDLCAELHPDLAMTNPLYSGALRTVVAIYGYGLRMVLYREADLAMTHADELEQQVQAAMRTPITAEAARRIMDELGCPTTPEVPDAP